MVIHALYEQWMLRAGAFQAEQGGRQSVLEQLDPQQRVAAVMAILGLVLIGLTLVAIVMIGAHWVRRMARHRPRSQKSSAMSPSNGENRRLRESLAGALPDADTNTTVQIDKASAETKVDP